MTPEFFGELAKGGLTVLVLGVGIFTVWRAFLWVLNKVFEISEKYNTSTGANTIALYELKSAIQELAKNIGKKDQP